MTDYMIIDPSELVSGKEYELTLKVEYEGVDYDGDLILNHQCNVNEGHAIYLSPGHLVGEVQIKEPVTVFESGDLVASREFPGDYFYLVPGQYMPLVAPERYSLLNTGQVYLREEGEFTSRDYTLVTKLHAKGADFDD